MSFGRDVASAAGESIFRWLIAAVAIGAGIALALAFGIPWAWSLIKPWLHALTA